MPGLMAEENELQIKQGLQVRENKHGFLRDNYIRGKQSLPANDLASEAFNGENVLTCWFSIRRPRTCRQGFFERADKSAAQWSIKIMSIRVTIADDHSAIRRIIRERIDSQPDMKTIGEDGNGKDAVERCLSLKPDIAIVDVNMPCLNGIEATRQIVSQLPQVKVLALSGDSYPYYVRGMLKAGASGYILKDFISEELTNAVRKIVKGGTYFSSAIKREIFSSLRDSIEHLTGIEEAILNSLAEGKGICEIASDIHLNPKKVYATSQGLVDKNTASDVRDLAGYIIREGTNCI